MIMSDDVVYRNLKVYKTLVARLLKKSGLKKKNICTYLFKGIVTSHSAYLATSTESDWVKVDGFFYSN